MPRPDEVDPDATRLVAELARRGLRIAVAESLTGGLVAARIADVPGASAVLNGGVVAYDSAVKRSLLGVSAALLEQEGAVHPEVARQMAVGVRRALAIDGRPADLGVATTGVAGPDPQDGKPPGTVFVAVAAGDRVEAIELGLHGDRAGIRRATVAAALSAVLERL
ncbi:nicotinamide-nucleotide amidase [Agromyces terreus]|uniref:Nicotinamide-nucleotide amidase n=2 Tax=Agromyces terreus TaxID=424795 RepID=A0A9X2H243_9MICO|nr:nicotinamide-nucleotide amidase [Agromyces terreus]